MTFADVFTMILLSALGVTVLVCLGALCIDAIRELRR